MVIPVTCARCGRTVQAPDAAAGKQGKCPKCGAVVVVPAAPTGEPAAAGGEGAAAVIAATAPVADAVAELAQALEATVDQAAGPATSAGEAAAEPAPIRPAPLAPATGGPVPAPAAPAPVEPPSAETAPPESDEIIAVAPIGVQTPSGLPAGRAGTRGHRWQRMLAGIARMTAFVLAALCLVLGIVAMILMASRGRTWLPAAVGVFVFMLILAAMAALGGLLARHVLLLLAELGETLHRQQDMLDRVNERLD